MHPEIHINLLAVVAAVFASFFFGWIWHGPLFGKKMMTLAGKSPEECKPDPEMMVRAMGLNILGTFLIAYVLAHDVVIWRPSTWGVGTDSSNCTYGFFAGFFIWLGYFIPTLLDSVAWERKSWGLFGIGAGYRFFQLQIIGMILAYWR